MWYFGLCSTIENLHSLKTTSLDFGLIQNLLKKERSFDSDIFQVWALMYCLTDLDAVYFFDLHRDLCRSCLVDHDNSHSFQRADFNSEKIFINNDALGTVTYDGSLVQIHPINFKFSETLDFQKSSLAYLTGTSPQWRNLQDINYVRLFW